MSKVTIKDQGLEIKLEKNMFVNADQTSDGIVFNFKTGNYYYVLSPYMPIETKEKIKQATDVFENADIVIDINNHKDPVYVDLTDKK